MYCALHCLQQQSAAKHKHRDEELMSEVTQLREKVAEKDEELQVSFKYKSTYANVHTQYTFCMYVH